MPKVFPNALVEAMALGVPVIARSCRSGPSEILDEDETLEIDTLHHGRYGLLVPPGDTAALAMAIETMAGDAAQIHYRKAALRVDGSMGASFLQRFWQVVEAEIQISAAPSGKGASPLISGANLRDLP